MKTFADFKQALKIGTKWKAFHVLDQKDLGIRTVAIVQTNAVAFKRENIVNLTWLWFPKANEIKINKEGKVEIYEEEKLFLIYEKIEE